jgi:hypothetical protein
MDEMDAGDDEDFEGFGPAARSREADVSFTSGNSMPHPAGSARRDGASTDPNEGGGSNGAATTPATADASTPGAEPKPAKKGRASVPSWDEIVFGAKHE